MKKRLFAIFFLVLMAVLGGASVAGYIKARNLSVDDPEEEAADVPAVHSFVEDYPFPEGGESSKRKSNPAADDMSVPEWIVSRTELFTNSENPFSPHFIHTLKLFDKLYRIDMFWADNTPFVRLPNGYFTFLYPYSSSVESRNGLLDFVGWLQGRDIKYLSLIAADKGDDDYAVFPEGVPHGYSRMVGEYREFNLEHGIEFLESREKLVAQNSDFFYWFYKTDHHWNVHAGLQIALETARRLNEMNVAADTNAVLPENFTQTCYPKSFLGSMGRKLDASYTEDFEVYYPAGGSRFHLRIPNLGIDRTNSFENTLIAGRYLHSESTSYSAFLYGDPPLVRIENLLSDNNTRVLVIKQSKADILCPYLALTVRYLDMIDPRHFDGSIRAFIEQTKPDIVITCNDVMYEGDEQFWRLK